MKIIWDISNRSSCCEQKYGGQESTQTLRKHFLHVCLVNWSLTEQGMMNCNRLNFLMDLGNHYLLIFLFVPFPTGESVLAVIDGYSRYPEIKIIKKTTSSKIISGLEEIFSRQGYPYTLKTDNGTNFTSDEFENYCTVNGIKHLKSQPYWPRGNAEVDIVNRTMFKAIRTAQAEGRDWKIAPIQFLRDYRSFPHSTKNESPAKLLFNRELRTKMPQIAKKNPEEFHLTNARNNDNCKRKEGERLKCTNESYRIRHNSR